MIRDKNNIEKVSEYEKISQDRYDFCDKNQSLSLNQDTEGT